MENFNQHQVVKKAYVRPKTPRFVVSTVFVGLTDCTVDLD